MDNKVLINGHKRHEIYITKCAVTTKLVSQEPCLKLKTGKRFRSCYLVWTPPMLPYTGHHKLLQ